jgi:hypothetical protein
VWRACLKLCMMVPELWQRDFGGAPSLVNEISQVDFKDVTKRPYPLRIETNIAK